jgi:hypothetical protein
MSQQSLSDAIVKEISIIKSMTLQLTVLPALDLNLKFDGG